MKVLVGILALTAAQMASAITIKSECDKPIFVAKGWFTGGGTDGIGDSGSWVKRHSGGWTRIGPYSSVDINARFIRVETNGFPITRVTSEQDKKVGYFCTHPTDKFDFENLHSSHRDNVKENAVVDCIKRGQVTKPYEDVSKYGTYTVYQNACNPNKNREEAIRLRARFRLENKGYSFFFDENRIWYKIENQGDYVEPLSEEKRDDQWIILKPNNSSNPTRYALGTNGVFQVIYSKGGSWNDHGYIGRWTDK